MHQDREPTPRSDRRHHASGRFNTDGEPIAKHHGHDARGWNASDYWDDHHHHHLNGIQPAGWMYAPFGGYHADHFPAIPSVQTPEGHATLTAVLGGDAWAVGVTTSAVGSVCNTVENTGACTLAFGDALFTASGTGAEHGAVAAGADTYLSVTGADFVFEFTTDTSGGKGSTAWAQADTHYLAIDFHNWSPPQGPIVFDFNTSIETGSQGGPQHDLNNTVPDNFASVIALADAHGPNTFTATVTNALSVENHFSLVDGHAIVAA